MGGEAGFSAGKVGNLAAILVFGFGVAALIRFTLGRPLLASASGARGAAPDAADAIRMRLAPLVIGIGAGGICIVALATIIAIHSTDDPAIRSKLDTILMGVFSAVLPVFATWVGTVLAFYYTNESFRQAAESTMQLMQPTQDGGPIADRMIPYEKIAKVELPLLPAAAGGAQIDKLDDIPMAAVAKPFSDAITRVIIFDKGKVPAAIIRKKLVDGKTYDKVGDYLAADGNAADAANFVFLPAKATVADGRRMLELHKTADIFVNDTGAPGKAVNGWVTDERLR
ncbi:hypothetical protein [Inquilinus sp.]|uniref:hypothetical protein n=1 Tax=Inquilinus sp. TaxID=1932117 RepID=UPI0037834555